MLEDQKIPIQEAYFDVESETLPTAPGSAWMMLEKRGARYHLHICKLGLQKPPPLGAPAQRLGLLSSVYSALEDRETGLSVRPTRTQSHPNTPGLEEQRV